MTQQEIFDTVLAHLRKQGKAAMDDKGNGQYRGLDGTACAVGCLIPDELYDPLIENISSDEIMGGGCPLGRDGDWPKLQPIMARIANYLGAENKALLSALQDAHDACLAERGLPTWEEYMRIIAHGFSLEYKPPQPLGVA